MSCLKTTQVCTQQEYIDQASILVLHILQSGPKSVEGLQDEDSMPFRKNIIRLALQKLILDHQVKCCNGWFYRLVDLDDKEP